MTSPDSESSGAGSGGGNGSPGSGRQRPDLAGAVGLAAALQDLLEASRDVVAEARPARRSR